MPSEAVQPLRINKSSPLKGNGTPTQRPLSEISPMERRRNSPSWNQATKKMIAKSESSPFDTAFPRQFWHSKIPSSPHNENLYDRPDSPAVTRRRTSIENLKKASRVKNSSMYALESNYQYDPTSPVIVERPLAAGRPLSGQIQENSQTGLGIEHPHKDAHPARGHRRTESQTKIALMSSPKSQMARESVAEMSKSPSPSRNQASTPSKSSMSNKQQHNTFPRSFDPNLGPWSDDESDDKVEPARPLRRQAKSVTFDAAPPQVNEYEMVTPDPSSVASGSREGSYEHFDDDDLYDMDRAYTGQDDDSFDASLEDTDKTPVVLPEDWRHMSPEAAENALVSSFDDPFDGNNSSMPATPSKEWNGERNVSVGSDGDNRPLPPLPAQSKEKRARRESTNNFSNIAERVHNAHRSLPTPPAAASISKSDILGMKGSSTMSLEDRLRLMGIRDPSVEKTTPDLAAREKARLQRHGLGIHVHEDGTTEDGSSKAPEWTFPHISRESILRKVRSRDLRAEQEELPDLASSPERSYDLDNLDPDVPIPSREASSNFDEVPIKEEPEEDILDLYSVSAKLTNLDTADREGSIFRHSEIDMTENVDESCYSTVEDAQKSSSDSNEDDGPPTPRPGDVMTTSTPRLEAVKGLPEFPSLMEDSDFQVGFESFMSKGHGEPEKSSSPLRGAVVDTTEIQKDANADNKYHSSRSVESQQDREPGSPDSVLHRPLAPIPSTGRDSPAIPEPLATIKAPGGKLKTRPSATPADLQAMVAARRQVSGSHPPPIPEKSPKRLSLTLENSTEAEENDTIRKAVVAHKKRRESFGMKLHFDDSMGEDLSMDLDKEFDRVIEGSKKGYLMRQDSKVIVAKRTFSNEVSNGEEKRPSSANDAVTSPRSDGQRKPSHERTKSWTTEPWNGRVRRKSIRGVDRKAISGPAPPLPGQESAVSKGLGTVLEDQAVASTQEETEEGTERGRLFVKVVGIKDLDLPLPQNERSWFQLTLDNGLHCVTTSRLELGRNAPIGQEFELVVLNDLEFQLTLQTKITPPAKISTPLGTPTKAQKSPSKKSSFALLLSPRKRREQARLNQKREEEEQERKLVERRKKDAAKANASSETAWDLLHELVGDDGSFGRAYVCLKNHEDTCFGRPIVVDMPIFNEWSAEDPHISQNSARRKRGGAALRKPPYEIGKLTLQMLYVPRPKGSNEEEMPKSMNACVREMAVAENTEESEWEGHLSQQGGDCPYWRRRFFRLNGVKLTAYHETTNQPRAGIDLSKAVKLIDDKTSLMRSGSKPGKGRRKSAFADEDQAYMFVEEGFRIRFANGEAIDFYADSTADKEGWMKALSVVVGKDIGAMSSWCQVVLRRERMLKARAGFADKIPRPRSEGDDGRSIHGGSKTAPSSPVKQQSSRYHKSATAETVVPGPRTSSRRQEVRSMIF